jgi:hypothetical protein
VDDLKSELARKKALLKLKENQDRAKQKEQLEKLKAAKALLKKREAKLL